MPSKKKGWMPTMRVFFPKYVTIHNARLTAVYWIVVIVVLGVAVYQFISGKRYEIKKLPEGEISICSVLCPPRRPSNSTQYSYCGSARSFDAPYSGIKCAPLCSTTSVGLCLATADLIQYSPGTAFLPTFYRESNIKGPTNIISNSNCLPSSLKPTQLGQVCADERNFWVPGVEDQMFDFTHKFIVAKPTSSIFGDQPDLTGGSLTGLATMVLKPDGSKLKVFKPGQKIQFSVKQLLEIAGIEELGHKDHGKMPNLDVAYTRPPLVEGDILPTPRLTGLQLTFDIYYTNEGFCQLNLEKEKVFESGAELSCISLQARRQWTQVEKTSQVDVDGSIVTRTYSGILIDFQIHGSFKFLDWSMIFRGITTIIIWLTIPIWVLYFFCILFLGQLSVIYNRVIHQEISLSASVVGLAGRLISHTSAFEDVKDQPDGLTKQKLYERFKLIMLDNEDLDEGEIRKFVEFVYEGIAVASAEGGETTEALIEEGQLIDMQDFCTVCSSNENITFDALVEIFDKDRHLGIAETIFVDDIIKAARSPSSNDEMRDRVKHAMVKQSTTAHNSAPSGREYDASSLDARYEAMNEEIREIKEECDRMLHKQTSVVAQVLHAEETLKKML